MANTFITPDMVAREAIMILKNNSVLPALVHRDYSAEFVAGVGDTITVRKPATFTAKEYVAASGTTTQTATEGSVSVKMDKLLDVTFEVTAADMNQEIENFSQQLLVPAMNAFLQKIDTLLAALVVDIPFEQTSTATAAFDDLMLPAYQLNKNKAPFENRSLVLGPLTHSKYAAMTQFVTANAAGTTDGLRNAAMGRVLGLDTFMDQNIGAFTKGPLVYSSAIVITTSAAAAATSIVIGATTMTGSIYAGDTFTVAGDTTKYVVTDAANTAANAATVKIYPALAVALGAAEVVTWTSKTTTEENIAFHKNAFALVTRPLALPLGNKTAYVVAADGFAIRVVYDYDSQYKKDVISLDMLCGVKTLTPELACRFKRV